MKNFFIVFQLVVSVLLIASIIIQSQGTGLGSAWGGGGGSYRSKRGMEKVLFVVTIILAILFFSASIISVLV